MPNRSPHRHSQRPDVGERQNRPSRFAGKDGTHLVIQIKGINTQVACRQRNDVRWFRWDRDPGFHEIGTSKCRFWAPPRVKVMLSHSLIVPYFTFSGIHWLLRTEINGTLLFQTSFPFWSTGGASVSNSSDRDGEDRMASTFLELGLLNVEVLSMKTWGIQKWNIFRNVW